ncbi:trace amine-associated receptor 13c-like [Megalops cyprinoides]|uniref:trace amine-associated receptor 13c-like n=1 Tax=Megalops cyprinoides TaxID=118141 RepID=UPI0018655AC2|nr:trace amine-associated receptor 13c-like [Megalops cyprinoides]
MNLTEANEEDLCAQPSNFSCFETASLTAVDVLMYSAAAAVVFLTVCGNLLVIISICHFKQLHTPTNLLLLSLAVADFLVGVTVMPFHFVMLIESHWCFDAVVCTIYNAASFYLTCVSIYNVACIAVDRYFALCNPFLYSTKMTVNLTLKIISLLWLYSMMYNVILLYFNGNITDFENTICAGECSVYINDVWAVVDFILVFIVPCLTITIMYLKVFSIAKRHANTIRCAREQHHSKETKKMNDSTASERKAAKTLGILVSAFLLCLVPYYISVFLDVYIRKPSVYLAVLNMLSLLYLNSSINPIIYALFYSWFQKCVKLIVTLKICSSDSSLINVLSKET